MWVSLIAVIGTVAGALVSGLLQHRAARTDRSDAQAEQVRRDRMDAVTALAVSLSNHRRAMWELREAVLADEPQERIQQLRDESHATRSEVTDPAVRVRLLIADEAVRAAATAAINTTYGMRDATSVDDLQARRRNALEMHDEMVNTAGTFLA